MSLQQYLSFRRTLPPRPPLARETVRARGIDFAVYRTPAVAGALPLLCINGGLLFDHSLLWPALAPLAASRQLILYDQRGRGASGVAPGVGASRIEFDAGDITALRVALGIEQWMVLGHSWGGGIAMLYTSQDQAAVERLVLVNAVGVDSKWLPPLHNAGIERLAGGARDHLASFDPAKLQVADAAYHAEYAKAFFPAWFADQEFAAAVKAPHGESITGANVAARLRRDGYDWRELMCDVSAPTLVVHGAEDVLPFAEAERTAATLRNARVQPIPHAGHNPFWESPATFFAHVDAFLSSTPAPVVAA